MLVSRPFRRLVTLPAAAAVLLACTNNSEASRSVGLLLAYGAGYAGGGTGAAEEYKTLALVVERDSVTTAVTAPNIVIPVGSGFERMGISTHCAYDGATKVENYRQEVWRIHSSQVPPPDTDCGAGSGSVGSVERPACDDHRAQVFFAGTRLWAERLTSQQTETCEPRGGHWSVSDAVKSVAGAAPISLGAIFGESTARDKFAVAMSQGLAELVNDGYNCPTPSPDAYDLSSWSVRHRRGAWTPVATVSEFAIYGDCQFSHTMELTMPGELTDEAPSRDLWSTVARVVPDLQDYFMSPAGDLMVVVSGKPSATKLQLLSLKRGRTIRKLWESPWTTQNEVVMARWSSGGTARTWANGIAGIQQK